MAKATKAQDSQWSSFYWVSVYRASFLRPRFFSLALASLLFPLASAHAGECAGPRPAAASKSEAAADALDRLNDCNWTVTYRGRTYDLAPLTREALARPLETDIRYALERVPEAAEHLNQMGRSLSDARVHSKIASVFLAGIFVSQALRGPKDKERRSTMNLISVGSGAFSLAGFLAAWKATREAKRELVQAVSSFNERSPYKIEPSVNGRANADAQFDFPPGEKPKELEDAEKNRP